MSATERLVSALLVAHVVALFVCAIPNPASFQGDVIPRERRQPVSSLALALDSSAAALVRLDSLMWTATTPLRGVSNAYQWITWQFQRWDMFSNASHSSAHARIGYRWRMPDGTTRTEYEEVLPSGPEYRVKVLRAYFDSFMDKALTVAPLIYGGHSQKPEVLGSPLAPDRLGTGLEVFTRYYARARLARGAPSGATLQAVEFWWGGRPIPSPFAPPDPGDSHEPPSVQWELWSVDGLQ